MVRFMKTIVANSNVCHQYKKNLIIQLGKSQGTNVYDKFLIVYNKLYSNREIYENKALNRHLVRNILPGIALYEAFFNYSHTKQEAIDLFKIFNRILYAKTSIFYKCLGKFPMFFRLLRLLSARTMSVTYPCEGWTTKWIENSSSKIAFDVSRCFYKDTLEKYDREELLPCFCGIDDELYENISNHVKWQRTQTLGRGGKICDFRFIAKEEKYETK